MTDSTQEQKKLRITKLLAITGLLAILIVIAWLSVRIVTLAPSAFSSLASLTDSIYGITPFSQEFEIHSGTTEDVIQSGESTTVSWNAAPGDGVFVFSYECVEGVSVEINTDAQGQRPVTCDTAYDIGTVTSLEFVAESEKNRFIDIPLTISFSSNNGKYDAETTDMITVVNASISPVVLNSEDESTDTTTESEAVRAGDDDSTNTSAHTPTASQSTTPRPTTEITYIYNVPVSDPNGYIDLAIHYRGVGHIENGRFVNTGSIEANKLGAIQFEVENTGTKTSNIWSFSTKLPTGTTYQSDTQSELGPKERAILSIGFPSPDAGTTADFSFDVQTGGDINLTNNDFSWSAEVSE